MGLLDIFKSKEHKPRFYNKHEDLRLYMLDDLLNRVGDDQKELLEKEKKLISIGLEGEKNVIYELEHNHKEIVFLHDVTLDNYCHDSQIDFIVLTSNCIIVLETKLLVGDITIDREGNFIRYFKNVKGEVYKKEGIYSPITQNRYHVDALKNLLDNNKLCKNVPIYSLVVIANPKTIINKKYANSFIQNAVIKYDQLNDKIYELMYQNQNTNLSYRKLEEIAELINQNDTQRSYDYVKKFNLKLKEEKFIDEDKVPSEDIQVIEKNDTKETSSDDTLYEALSKYRYAKSKALNIPVGYVFNNDTLSELVLNKPLTEEDILNIKGMGPKKYEMYGVEIIRIIKKYSNIESSKEEPNQEINKDKYIKQLKAYRTKKANDLNLKPYMIFNNAEMESLVEIMPKSKEEFIKIKGFGEKKFESFGEDILNILKNK